MYAPTRTKMVGLQAYTETSEFHRVEEPFGLTAKDTRSLSEKRPQWIVESKRILNNVSIFSQKRVFTRNFSISLRFEIPYGNHSRKTYKQHYVLEIRKSAVTGFVLREEQHCEDTVEVSVVP